MMNVAQIWPALMNLVFMALLISSLYLLGTSRIGALISTAGAQGVLLAVLPLFPQVGEFSYHAILLAVASGLIKGALIPWLLLYALRDANIKREVEPYVGYSLSLAMGVAFIAISFWFAAKIAGVDSDGATASFVAVAISMTLCGLFIIASRKKALTQVIGYLTLENGIYVFGVSLAAHQPFVVDMGIFLDVFVFVFVGGIVGFRINRTFDSIEQIAESEEES
ncbi:MAG: hydrogenase [Nitrospinae bacterium]|nr:hydrogenase [Nitrospinota bacterium]